ncbi:MAG: Peptidase M23, partial [Parcubacteria group bacterium Gr01-1014_33]
MKCLSRTYHKSRKQVLAALFFVAIIAAFSLYSVPGVGAESLEELQKDVLQKKEEIKKLEEEAMKYRQEIAAKQSVGKTLNTELNRITSEIKRVRADIAITEKKVQKTMLEIRGLHIEISEKEASIQTFKAGLGALIQAFAEKGDESLIELVMKYDAVSDFFQQVDFLGRTQERIKRSLAALRIVREDLLAKKANAEEKKEELE